MQKILELKHSKPRGNLKTKPLAWFPIKKCIAPLFCLPLLKISPFLFEEKIRFHSQDT